MKSKPIIHLLSVAGGVGDLAAKLGLHSSQDLIQLAQQTVGPAYAVTANRQLMEARIDDQRGGRRDDKQRIADLEQSLANDETRAIVPLRGGAWLTRLLDEVDFEVVARRQTPVFFFGYSELTTVVNITGSYSRVHAFYDISPGYAHSRQANGREHLTQMLSDVVRIVEGRCSHRRLSGKLIRGSVKPDQIIHVVGGCLSVVVTLLGTRFDSCLRKPGLWLALEDTREQIYRIDRYLAQLKLSGVFRSCAGLLLGDFHLESTDQTEAVLELLKYHLPGDREVPIIAHCNFGHRDDAAPLPINRPLTLRKNHETCEVEFVQTP